MTDYGEDLVSHFLLNELRAEGHLELTSRGWLYSGHHDDFLVGITVKKINKTVRLSED